MEIFRKFSILTIFLKATCDGVQVPKLNDKVVVLARWWFWLERSRNRYAEGKPQLVVCR